jgi:nicotinate phosphoribosyltransferase
MMAGKLLGIPVRGTHAHSWVMSFDDEEQAFMEYAKALPNNCIFLVDTYNSLEGVKKAVRAGMWLREHGSEMTGIRLDSGDLAYLSIEARKLLDENGFKNTSILASNQLDEAIITSLKDQGAKIDIWGVGTKLVTAYDEPALDGVYKLSAVRNGGDKDWKFRIKISEQAAKITNPGILQVRRFEAGGENIADCIFDLGTDLSSGCEIVDPQDQTRRKTVDKNTAFTDLLEPVFLRGKRVYPKIDINEIRLKTLANLEKFHPGIKRFVNPHRYPAGLEKSLFDTRTAMVLSKKGDGMGGSL